ncbi:hypothetical protein LINPERHAP2_LOCUS17393, partial [Linum perenne]
RIVSYKPKIRDGIVKFLIPLFGSLFQTVQGLSQSANFTIRVRFKTTRWLFHINFFI